VYQFPDSADDINSNIHQTNSEPLSTSKCFKFILVANLLLALFIASIVWFLFFFDSPPSTTALKLPTSQENKQKTLQDFTPVATAIKESTLTPSSQKTIKNINIQTIVDAPKEKKIATTKQANNESNTSIKSVQTSVKKKNISAIDAITQELERNQLKNKAVNLSIQTSTSHDNAITAAPSSKKPTLLKPNQIIIKSAENTVLEKLITHSKKNLGATDQALVKSLETIITPDTINTIDNIKSRKTNNSDIHNSISLQKTKDIDKIMAAMGSIKKSSQAVTIEKIEDKVKHLLKSEKNKYRKTDQYVAKLQPEAKVHNNEMRTITVKKDGSIWDIAVRAYGDGKKYKKILEANPLIKKDPKLLKSGITLRVPI